MEKIYYLKENRYIRLKINRPTNSFRASIAINKYCWGEKENRHYEIDFDTFSPYDYKDEEEALERAKDWLNKRVKEFQSELVEYI